MEKVKSLLQRIKNRLAALSFRTGMIVLGLCAVCYMLAFLPAAFPISLAWKGALWVIFFGLAKTFQYTGLIILGKEGIKRLKSRLKRKKEVIIED